MKWSGEDHGTHVVMRQGPSKVLLMIKFIFWDVPFILFYEVPREWRRQGRR